MSHHQIAKAAVATMVVRAVEMNSESAANLIQSITASPFPVGSIAQGFQWLDRQSVSIFFAIFFVELWPFARHVVAISHT
jgi:hypothetical protein